MRRDADVESGANSQPEYRLTTQGDLRLLNDGRSIANEAVAVLAAVFG